MSGEAAAVEILSSDSFRPSDVGSARTGLALIASQRSDAAGAAEQFYPLESLCLIPVKQFWTQEGTMIMTREVESSVLGLGVPDCGLSAAKADSTAGISFSHTVPHHTIWFLTRS